MTGIQHGVAKQVLERARQAKWTQCFLHRENLAARQISPHVHDVMSVAVMTVMSVAVMTVNYMKKNAPHSSCFSDMCDRLNSDHVYLLYHCEVSWLLKERVLNRIFELRRQVYMFVQDQCFTLAEHCSAFVLNWPTFQMCLTS